MGWNDNDHEDDTRMSNREPASRLRHHSIRWFRGIVGVVGRLELSVLVAAALIVGGTWGFLEIADHVSNGTTQTLDERIIKGLRLRENPAVPIGPHWVYRATVDVTALGGETVITLVTLAVAGYIILNRRYGAFVLVLLASSGVGILNSVLKNHFARERPTVVPRLVEETSKSFPSGHAMASAAVYLSLAVLLARLAHRKRDRLYILGTALSLTAVIGMSRIYLAAHYPTDVLAGWSAGIAWAMLCWLAVRVTPGLLERSTHGREDTDAQ